VYGVEVTRFEPNGVLALGGGWYLVLERVLPRKFSLYWWLLIRFGSSVMLRLLFDAVRRRAERGAITTPMTSG
jgi:hypothetical protein